MSGLSETQISAIFLTGEDTIPTHYQAATTALFNVEVMSEGKKTESCFHGQLVVSIISQRNYKIYRNLLQSIYSHVYSCSFIP